MRPEAREPRLQPPHQRERKLGRPVPGRSTENRTMSQVLTQASHQWSTRPDDERFTSLTAMLAHFGQVRAESSAVVVPSKHISLVPDSDNRGLTVSHGDH